MMKPLRWQQRLENFEKAILLLKEGLSRTPLKSLSDLEKEGIIQRFEYTFELAWKTLKDYLVYQGVTLDQTTPRAVIKQAFAMGVIKDGQAWIEMLDNRNLMSHTYNFESFKKAFSLISENYFQRLFSTYEFLKKQVQ